MTALRCGTVDVIYVEMKQSARDLQTESFGPMEAMCLRLALGVLSARSTSARPVSMMGHGIATGIQGIVQVLQALAICLTEGSWYCESDRIK